MANERISEPTMQGIGHALQRSYPPAPHDREEADERHLLRRIDIKDAVK